MQENLEVRERILTVATTLFHRQGYNETGINQIIKEANVAKASLYYHFATKDDLCIAYLKRRHEVWNDTLQEFIRDKEDKILAVFDFLMEDNEQCNYRGCSFLNLLPEVPPGKKEMLSEVQEHKKGVLAFFEAEIKGSDPDLPFTVYSLFENAIIESQLFQSQEPVLRLKRIVVSLLRANG
ncbi:TetR/AcrR family transcriptional regulator [Fulvivirga sp. M361]|uniref:TetR/AcrR family transcriptional regulator n=1 Tax=Fulvivirga sp. M361 TaxID=2594266 RepID=UPI00117A6D8A|nr:TetR/AcrR family transcriptional regulator [Fulvivirga sp. M361]TRX60577.1 TetR/AcrR family transcriptional regulator [Fulvivirga sp. M361]